MSAVNIIGQEGSVTTVECVRSPSGGNVGVLYRGAGPATFSVADNDVLKITIAAERGYELVEYDVEMPVGNPISFSSGSMITVTSDICIWSNTRHTLMVDYIAEKGSTIVVKRLSSSEGAPIGSLAPGASIYPYDVLSISFSADFGYELTGHTVEHPPGTYIDFSSGSNLTVEHDVRVMTKARKILNLYISETEGANITVERLNSADGGSLGVLEPNARLYAGDVLQVTCTADAGYEISNIRVEHPIGTAINFSSGGLLVVSDDVSIRCEAQATMSLSIQKTEGAIISVERISSRYGGSVGALTHGAKLYTDDVIRISFSAKSGYELTGYTVEHPVGTPISFKSGGELVVADGVAVRCAARRILTLTVTKTNGVDITVKRVKSPEGASVGTLSNGARIYVGDVLSIVFTAAAGQEITGCIVEHPIGVVVPFESGEELVVVDNVAVRGETRDILTLGIIDTTGVIVSVERISSPEGASVGAMSNGDRIYIGDVLRIAFADGAGYEILAQTVEHPAGTVVNFKSGDQLVVADNVLVQCLIKELGVVRISDSGELQLYHIYIDNGTEFEMYTAYVDNGKSWDPITM